MKNSRDLVVGSCVVGVFATLAKAEHALLSLRRAGFQQNQISLVSWHPKNSLVPIDKLKVGDDPATDSAICAGLGGVLGMLGGTVVAEVTGLGTFFLIGPIAALFAGALVGSLVGALAGLNVRHNHIRYYEDCLKQGNVLVIAHGNPDELNVADRVLAENDIVVVHRHTDPPGSRTPPPDQRGKSADER
ncbi:MAG TPA: hypothetical protein VMF30_16595 [Pirellulales bacterium]|nr:hypothetical protein [Pirellulales bacterium]